MGCCVLAAGATWLIMLEMEGRSVDDVDRLFQGVGARESERWESGIAQSR